MRAVLWVLTLLSACGGEGDLVWHNTCGDGLCCEYIRQGDSVPLCGFEGSLEGDPCEAEGEMCDPQNRCNVLRVCAREDPREAAGCEGDTTILTNAENELLCEEAQNESR